MDLYTEKIQKFCSVRKSTLYFIPGEYSSAKLHSINVKTWWNITQTEIPLRNHTYWSKKNLKLANVYQHAVRLESTKMQSSVKLLVGASHKSNIKEQHAT